MLKEMFHDKDLYGNPFKRDWVAKAVLLICEHEEM